MGVSFKHMAVIRHIMAGTVYEITKTLCRCHEIWEP